MSIPGGPMPGRMIGMAAIVGLPGRPPPGATGLWGGPEGATGVAVLYLGSWLLISSCKQQCVCVCWWWCCGNTQHYKVFHYTVTTIAFIMHNIARIE